MARGVVSLLSLFLLSATASTGRAFSFQHVLLPASSSTAAARAPNLHHDRTRLHMTTFQHAIADEDRLRVEGIGGAERTRLAESIAEEFRAQTAVVRAAYEAEMEQQRAAHKLDLAQHRVTLLEVSEGAERVDA